MNRTAVNLLLAALKAQPKNFSWHFDYTESCLIGLAHNIGLTEEKPSSSFCLMEALDIPEADARQLSHPDIEELDERPRDWYVDITPEDAHIVLKHYADTGKVNWHLAPTVQQLIEEYA